MNICLQKSQCHHQEDGGVVKNKCLPAVEIIGSLLLTHLHVDLEAL